MNINLSNLSDDELKEMLALLEGINDGLKDEGDICE